MKIKSVNEINNLFGKRVLLRLDLNVPIAKGKVVDDFRIKAALPTITLLRDAGAKVIIISHIEGKGGGKSKGAKTADKGKSKSKENSKEKEFDSLRPVAECLKEKRIPITFVEKYFTGSAQEVLNGMKNGDVVLFENLRSNKGEVANDPEFAKNLASMAEIYVNEAFPVSHRPHASIVGVPKLLPSYAGPVFMREIKNLSSAFNPEKPFLFVLGGAKFDTKMPLIQKFISLADFIFIGGALANNFFKELNFEVGRSTVSEGNFQLAELLKTKKVFIPTDVVTISTTAPGRKTKSAHAVLPNEKILDVGPKSLVQLNDLIRQSKFVLWNGPLGNYEEGFSESTQELAEIISKAKAKSVVGGGDTVAAIQTLGLLDKFTFVSTGGGAMLDFLANETLPGIEALKESK